MSAISRRTLIRQILPGAVVTATGVAAVAAGGMSVVLPNTADAMPLAIDKTNPLNIDELFQKTQAVVVVPPAAAGFAGDDGPAGGIAADDAAVGAGSGSEFIAARRRYKNGRLSQSGPTLCTAPTNCNSLPRRESAARRAGAACGNWRLARATVPLAPRIHASDTPLANSGSVFLLSFLALAAGSWFGRRRLRICRRGKSGCSGALSWRWSISFLSASRSRRCPRSAASRASR